MQVPTSSRLLYVTAKEARGLKKVQVSQTEDGDHDAGLVMNGSIHSHGVQLMGGLIDRFDVQSTTTTVAHLCRLPPASFVVTRHEQEAGMASGLCTSTINRVIR